MRSIRTCSISGCDRKHVARGWCSHHYTNWKNNGDPNKVMRVMGDLQTRLNFRLKEAQNGCIEWACDDVTHIARATMRRVNGEWIQGEWKVKRLGEGVPS